MTAEIGLPEVLNTQGAKKLLKDLRQAADKDVTLKGDKVRHVGAQAVQVLLAARPAWQAAGHAFSISDPSDEMRRGLELLGADGLLDEVPA